MRIFGGMMTALLIFAALAHAQTDAADTASSKPPAGTQTQASPVPPSIGEQAGSIVNTMDKNSKDARQQINRDVDKALKDLQARKEELSKNFNAQYAKMSQDLQTSFRNIQEALNREVRKFNETRQTQSASKK
jgi:gas vesicle protein